MRNYTNLLKPHPTANHCIGEVTYTNLEDVYYKIESYYEKHHSNLSNTDRVKLPLKLYLMEKNILKKEPLYKVFLDEKESGDLAINTIPELWDNLKHKYTPIELDLSYVLSSLPTDLTAKQIQYILTTGDTTSLKQDIKKPGSIIKQINEYLPEWAKTSKTMETLCKKTFVLAKLGAKETRSKYYQLVVLLGALINLEQIYLEQHCLNTLDAKCIYTDSLYKAPTGTQLHGTQQQENKIQVNMIFKGVTYDTLTETVYKEKEGYNTW